MLCLLINYCSNFPSNPLVLRLWGTRQGNWIYDDAIFLCFISLQLWEWPAPSMLDCSSDELGGAEGTWAAPKTAGTNGQVTFAPREYILPSVHQLYSIKVWLEFQLLLDVWITGADNSIFFQNVLRSHFCNALNVMGWKALQEQK